MKHLKKVLLFIILLSYQSYSQTVPEGSGQIKVYDSYQPAPGSSTGEKNKISINPLGLLIGDYPLYYERMFGNTFSVELGVGLTYENYMGNLTNNLDGTGSDYHRNFKLGSTYSISPKIYLDDDNFEGSYLCVVYRHRMYNAEVVQYHDTKLDTPMKEYNKLNSFTFNYGYVMNLGKGFLMDYYIGVGVRTQTLSQVNAEYVGSSGYPNYVSTYSFTTEKSTRTLPTGMWGIKLSYSF